MCDFFNKMLPDDEICTLLWKNNWIWHQCGNPEWHPFDCQRWVGCWVLPLVWAFYSFVCKSKKVNQNGVKTYKDTFDLYLYIHLWIVYTIQILGFVAFLKQINTITTSQIHDPHYVYRENMIEWSFCIWQQKNKEQNEFQFRWETILFTMLVQREKSHVHPSKEHLERQPCAGPVSKYPTAKMEE